MFGEVRSHQHHGAPPTPGHPPVKPHGDDHA
jgi:hypothetical protein